MLKWLIFALLKSPKLISRKIWKIEKSWNFYTVHFKSQKGLCRFTDLVQITFHNCYSREEAIWISRKKLDFIKQRSNGVRKGQMYGRILPQLRRISLVFRHCAIDAHKRRKFGKIEKLSRFYHLAIRSQHPITFAK